MLVGDQGTMGDTPGVWLRPRELSLRYLRATAEGLPDLDAMDESGVVEIVAEHWEDGLVRVPFAAWSKKTVEAPRSEPLPARVVSLAPDGTATVKPAGP